MLSQSRYLGVKAMHQPSGLTGPAKILHVPDACPAAGGMKAVQFAQCLPSFG
jgi:hypothetical protein